MDNTGWTLPTIYAMRLHEVRRAFEHWSKTPSVAACLRGLAGWKPEAKAEKASPEAVRALGAMLAGR